MPKMESSIIINVPIEKVWAYVDDLSNATKWGSNILEAKPTSPGSTRVGSTYAYTIQAIGQKMETTGEITAYDPPRESAWKAIKSPFPMNGSTVLEAVAGGTRVTQTINAEPGGFFKLAEPLLVKQQQSQMEADLARLKQILEVQ